MKRERISLGIAARAGRDVVERLAPAVEAAGLRSLWINETPGTDALELSAAALAATQRLQVATGVIAVDRRPTADLVAQCETLGLGTDRFTIGIGSGRKSTGALALVRDAVTDLRSVGVPIVVGALGPKMRRLAAEHADGVVLNWLDPASAAAQTAEHHEIDPDGRVVLYVRTITDPAARSRLEAEAEQYASFPKYAANFARLGLDPLDTVLPAPGDEHVGPGADAYAGAVDEVVLRAVVAGDDPEDYLRFVDRLD